MNDNREKWIKDIRNRMENYSEPLPDGLWKEIEAEISTPKVIPMWKKWYAAAAAIAAVIIVSTISVGVWDNLFQNKYDSVSVNETNNGVGNEYINTPKGEENLLSQEIGVNTLSHEIVKDKKKNIEVPISYRTSTVNAVSLSDTENDKISDNTENASYEKNDIPQKENDESKTHKRAASMKADRDIMKRNASYLAMNGAESKTKGNIQLGVMTGNTPYSSSDKFSGMSTLSVSRKSMSQVNGIVMDEMADGEVSYSQVLFSNRDQNVYTDVKHHIPVTFGLTMKWAFNDKWALESGLNYTYLYSELSSGTKSYVKDEQKLHYIGIPIKIHRTLWNNNRFNIYASAGGMVEKCVSATIETEYADADKGKKQETEKISDKPFQLSVSGSVGAQINFNKYVGFYVEPGMAYYFDDNSEILTIRKDKPFNFNLQLGLRLNLGN